MKILMVGMGSIGQRHARNLKVLLGENLELLAYRVRGHSSLIRKDLKGYEEASIEDYFGLRTFDDLDKALDEKPVAAFVCNPNNAHLDTAMKIANRGCHLFIEKPLSHNLEGLDLLLNVVEEKKLINFVGYTFRFHPGYLKLQKILEQQTLGRLLSVNMTYGEYLPDWHPYEDYRRTYVARKDLGGGILLTQIHDIDVLCSFFGLPRKLLAMGGHLSALEIDVDDSVDLLMEFGADGAHFPVHLHQDMVQSPPMRRYEFFGEKGRVQWDLIQGHLTLQLFKKEAETFDFSGFNRNEMFLDQTRHFLNCLTGKANSCITIKEASKSLKVVMASKASLENGQFVFL